MKLVATENLKSLETSARAGSSPASGTLQNLPNLKQTPHYKLIIKHPEGYQAAQTIKEFIWTYLQVKYQKKYPSLGDRIENSKLIQRDLFILNKIIPEFFIARNCTYRFVRC